MELRKLEAVVNDINFFFWGGGGGGERKTFYLNTQLAQGWLLTLLSSSIKTEVIAYAIMSCASEPDVFIVCTGVSTYMIVMAF